MKPSGKISIQIGDLATPINLRAGRDCRFPVYAVTKHDGMVPSANYFKKQVFSRDTEGYKVVRRGQFAYSTIHLDEGSIGILDEADSAIISPMYTVFDTDDKIVFAPFLLRVLKSDWALAKYQAMGNGSVHRRRSIPFDVLARMRILLPSLDEQRRLCVIIEKAESVRRKREYAIDIANDFLRSSFVSMFGDPVTNPKKWPIGTIRDLVSSANYGTSKKAHETEGRFPILRMNNISFSGRIDLTSLKFVDLDSSEESKYLAYRDDLLFNRTNSKELVGKTAVYESDEPMAIAGYLVRVRTNERGNPHYLSAFLNSNYGKQLLQSICKSIVGMANINAQELQNIEIMLPPRSLQDEYAEVVKRTRAVESRLNASLKNVEALHASLSQRLLA